MRPRFWQLMVLGLLGFGVVIAGTGMADTPGVRTVGAVTAAAPSPAPPSGRAPACPGKTKIERGVPVPKMWCEVSPGTWVEIDPKDAGKPGAAPCPGQTAVPSLGGPAPFVYCSEAKPGQPAVPNVHPWATPPNAEPGDPHPCQGFLDVGCQARKAVTGWFRDLVKNAADPTFKFLGSTILATPEIHSADMARPRELWGTSRIIANTCFVLLVTLAGVTLMNGSILPREMGLKELLPRVVFAFLAANLSLFLIGYGISFANGLARAFLAAGQTKIDPAEAANVLARGVEAAINTWGIFLILLALVVVILAVCVAFIYIIRLAITMVLIASAPVALMFHALPYTEGLALLWWRAITGMLAIQVCQSLVFVTALQLLLSEDTDANKPGSFMGVPTTKHDALDLLMMICLLWVLIRIPSWVSRTIWRQARPQMVMQVAKSFLVYRTAGAVINRVSPGTHRPNNRRRTGGA